ncbi:hypothetical protein [Desulfobacula toluolica]|uniref:Conserved uncharacterized protein n=1 Tax=Desulfobacula toluolica (strain DSM 7467 / Tol2) TaxID=651182 RepID=K0NTG8_DESTT|nr:hypothetical protein [Desulfobacula toluolica]CCK82352.1 conserved uncharacterized protein [Desulfobacula toluolica Tol2]
MKGLKQIWNWAGNIYVTMGIMGVMILDLLAGYVMLKYHAHLFNPINDLGFLKWSATWGKESLGKTGWLFILVGLLAALSFNTFACTTDRVVSLLKNRHRFKSRSRFVLRFGPHVMHYSMLIMFLGYLVSYLFAGTHVGKVLLPGKTIQVSGSRITLETLDIEYYTGNRLLYMEKQAIDIRAKLLLQAGENTKLAVLSFNRPVRFQGLSIHLKDFAPKTRSNGMDRRQFVTLIIKQDPGVGFYFTGMVCFTLGLLMYAWEKIFSEKRYGFGRQRQYMSNQTGQEETT